jgi:peptide/nickel transport system substrate-binding protein
LDQKTDNGEVVMLSLRRRLLGAAFAAVGILTLLSPGVDAAAPERLVMAMTPPAGDTNLFWGSSGDLSLFLTMGRLVGNDAETGAYSNDGLAESWEANDDFSEWTFHLKRGVPFHDDWGEVTAADVVHSYELNAGPDSQHSGVAQLRGATTEIVDDHTVKFIFDEPRQGFLFSLASRGSLVVYSKAQFDAEGLDGYLRRPAGTEQFRLVERRIGEGVSFERVEDHWSGQDATFPEIELRWVAEPSTKLAMLLAGEAHIADLPPELMGDAVAGGMEIVASLNPSMHVTGVLNGLYMTEGDPNFNPDVPWLDIRVREAMNRSIDREQFLEILYDGRAELLPRYGMDPRHEGYEPSLAERFDDMYGYDPERAKELLAEAGYPENFANPVVPIVLTALGGNPEFGTMAELLQVSFEAIGMQTEMREMDWATLRALGLSRQAYVVNPIRNAPIRPTEVHFLNTYTTTGSPFEGWEDDHMLALIDKFVNSFDAEERDALAKEAFTYAFEQYSDLPMAAVSTEIAINPAAVAGWRFPGVTTNGISHWHLIEPAS